MADYRIRLIVLQLKNATMWRFLVYSTMVALKKENALPPYFLVS